MADLTPTCVWVTSADLLVAVHPSLGRPTHSYDNGGQTWLRKDGPGGLPVEWHLHARADLARPHGLSSADLLPRLAGALARGEQPDLDPTTVWVGLEAAPAFDDPVAPDHLADSLAAVLGRRPDASGPLDRAALSRRWEMSYGRLDVVAWAMEHIVA